MLAIGKFDQRTEKTKCGTELELYLETKDADKRTYLPLFCSMFDFGERK
jgi:aminopeptidase N